MRGRAAKGVSFSETIGCNVRAFFFFHAGYLFCRMMIYTGGEKVIILVLWLFGE